MIQLTHRGADVEVFNAIDQHDIAGLGGGHHFALQSLELQDLIDAGFFRRAIGTVLNHDVLERFQTTAINTANADFSDIA